jgi:hypothetical protein
MLHSTDFYGETSGGEITCIQTLETPVPVDVNIKAAERMGRLHDALKASGYSGHPLELLLVRILFCLFADDTGIFQPAQAFRSFIEERTAIDGSDLGPRLAQLFQALNTPETQRSRALDEQVAAFPTRAHSTGRPSVPLFLAACSKASWTTAHGATWARTTPQKKTS